MTPAQFKEAREKLGLTQTQAANMLGYGAYTRISEIESGKRPIMPHVVRLMGAYLAGYRPDDWPVP